jgi:hypothetical protein
MSARLASISSADGASPYLVNMPRPVLNGTSFEQTLVEVYFWGSLGPVLRAVIYPGDFDGVLFDLIHGDVG